MLTDLAFVAYNPRRIGEDEFARLAASIREHTRTLERWNAKDGYRLATTLTVNRRGNRIVGGEQRIRALGELGQEWVHAGDITWVDISPGSAAEKALCVALNNRESQGEFTEDVAALLAEICAEMPGESDDLGLKALLDSVGRQNAGAKDGKTDPDQIPEPPDAADSQPGTIYRLGDHRLMCGDSASPEDLDRLLGGKPIHLVNMDPPYNVKVEPRSNNAIAAGGKGCHQEIDLARHPEKAKRARGKMRAKDRPLANDFVTDEAFDELLLAWFGNASRVLAPGRSFYIWGGYANCANYPAALKAHDLYFSQAIIWVKEHPVLTRKDFMGNHEWCFYGWKLGAAHRFFGPANATDVWPVKKLCHQEMVHLTEKPVELAERAVQYSSQEGENVLDLFGGSGSTLIACERLGRNAFLMEIDPLYCDVIRRRWAEFRWGENCDWKKKTRPTRR